MSKVVSFSIYKLKGQEPVFLFLICIKLKEKGKFTFNSKLTATSLDFLIIVKFNILFSNISAENFIEKILANKLQSKYIFISRNFKFGKKRLGDINTLERFKKKYSYKIIITTPYQKNKKIISSTLIRKNITKGNFDSVRKFATTLGAKRCKQRLCFNHFLHFERKHEHAKKRKPNILDSIICQENRHINLIAPLLSALDCTLLFQPWVLQSM